MARAPKQTQAVVNWEEQMAEQADIAAGQQRSVNAGGKFFSMRAGELSFDGVAMPGNQLAAIILADTMENSYYEGAFDPDVPASPKCFAFAKSEDDLEPHENVDKEEYFERQNATCAGCPQNEWGSAPTGRGKACKNIMRLAIIPAGQYKLKGGRNAGMDLELFDDPDHFTAAQTAFIKLPVMSVKNYSTFVKQLATDLRRPPHGVYVNIFLTPDPKSQYRVNFEVIDNVPNELMSIIMKRHNDEQETIAFPYTPPAVDEAPKAAPSNNKLKRSAASPPATRRR